MFLFRFHAINVIGLAAGHFCGRRCSRFITFIRSLLCSISTDNERLLKVAGGAARPVAELECRRAVRIGADSNVKHCGLIPAAQRLVPAPSLHFAGDTLSASQNSVPLAGERQSSTGPTLFSVLDIVSGAGRSRLVSPISLSLRRITRRRPHFVRHDRDMIVNDDVARISVRILLFTRPVTQTRFLRNGAVRVR